MRRPAAGVGGVLSVKPASPPFLPPDAPTSGDAVGVCGRRDSVGGRGAAAEKRSGAARVGERRKPAVEWAVGYLLAG